MSHKFLNKRTVPLDVQLCSAIENNVVGTTYEDSEKRKPEETVEQYVERIKEEALKYQFVGVHTTNGEIKYIAFGTPGSVINQYGEFWLIPGQVVGGRWGIHYFLVYKNLQNALKQENLFVRIDSGCFIGMVLNDNTCDCKQQLDLAMEIISKNKSGMIIEIPGQDGRGWNEFKMANQRITNELGIDTVDIANMFYEDREAVDQRTYDEAALIMLALGFKNIPITLGTNNPKKINAFLSLGINVVDSKNIISDKLSDIAKNDLRAKAAKWNHSVII